MSQDYYTPSSEPIMVLYKHCLPVKQLLQLPTFLEVNGDLLEAILEEAAKFAKVTMLPLNRVGDQQGCRLERQEVVTPEGFKELYQQFCQSGWNALHFPTEYKGQALPQLLASSVTEFWSGSNMAFGLCPLLTQGAAELLYHYGSEEQKTQYLSRLVSGEWTGTMCLTEPQAGSDLGKITTRATKEGNYYRIKGSKIYITYGEHDWTDNIIHLVLARIDNAPEGSKGISLFIVPKFLDDNQRNDVICSGIEHKLGIHASPTCTMLFGEKEGAVGYLVGKEHHGLAQMFTMMNNARLAVGIEGVGVAENSYQQAMSYAKERVQGVPIGGKQGESIQHHPDIRHKLAYMGSHLTNARFICLSVAIALDFAKHHEEAETREYYQDLADFLTPVAKAYSTDTGFVINSKALQLFGGMGFIEETGIAQNLRDSRITMIYEGTNAIQELDLVMRKLRLHEGRLYQHFKQWLTSFVTTALPDEINRLLEKLDQLTEKMQGNIRNQPEEAAFYAHDYLMLIALSIGLVLHHHLQTLKQQDLLSYETHSEYFLTNQIHDIHALINKIL